MIDKNLFVYVTRSTGHTLSEAARVMSLSVPSLSKRLNGSVSFRASEMAAWMTLTGTLDAGPIFFPDIVACPQHSEVTGHGSEIIT